MPCENFTLCQEVFAIFQAAPLGIRYNYSTGQGSPNKLRIIILRPRIPVQMQFVDDTFLTISTKFEGSFPPLSLLLLPVEY